jgi:hypothetical protein
MIGPPRFIVRLAPCVLTFIVVAAFCPGCSRHGGVPIQGEVTFDGKPVEKGTISLEPADGNGPVAGGRITAGKYQLTGVGAPLPGKKIVRITAVRKTGRKFVDGFSTTGAMVDEVERYLPDIYNSRSTLSCEVAADGPTQIDFHLRSP